jgi:hypothetical protein
VARILTVFSLILLSANPILADLPALAEIKKRAEAGEAASQSRLAKSFHDAYKYDEACDWYRKAALQGEINALLALARYYVKGMPKMFGQNAVKANSRAAVALYELLASMGEPRAQLELANQYNRGTIVPRNRAKAYQLYRLCGLVTSQPSLDLVILEIPTPEIEELERRVREFKPVSFEVALIQMLKSELTLDGILGSEGVKVASINGVVFGVGETNEVEAAGLTLKLQCKSIERDKVHVAHGNHSFELILRTDRSGRKSSLRFD